MTATLADYGVTFATLRHLVESSLALDAAADRPRADYARGYARAMRDVKAVLDKHGAPPGEPVHFGEQT